MLRAVVTNDRVLAKAIRSLRNYGTQMKMSTMNIKVITRGLIPLQAAFIRVKLLSSNNGMTAGR